MGYSDGVIGLISDIDPQKMRVKVKIAEQDDFTTDWLPMLVMPGMYYVPKAKDQVFVFMDEEFENGIVMGGVYNPAQFNNADILAIKFPGTELQINKQTGEVSITTTGKMTLKTSELDVQGDLKLTGNFELIGNLSGSAKITAVGVIKSNTDVTTSTVSLNTHMHPSAATGPPSPPTPVPQT